MFCCARNRNYFEFEEGEWDAIVAYFTDLFKISLVGPPGCGKTSLIARVTKKGSDNCVFDENYVPTIGVDFKIHNVIVGPEKRGIKIQMWDLAGDPRFDSVVVSYMRGQHIMLVFDVTDESSFESIRDVWYPKVASNLSSNYCCVLVGNKCDSDHRVVSTERGIQLAQELGIAIYMDVSAKDNIRVDDAFVALVQGAHRLHNPTTSLLP